MIDFTQILAQASYYYSSGNDFYSGTGGAMGGMYSGVTIIGLGLVLLAAMLGGIVQMGLKNAFNRYSQEPAPSPGRRPPAACSGRTSWTMCRSFPPQGGSPTITTRWTAPST